MKAKRSMNKADLVNEAAKMINTKKIAQAAVDCVFASITNALHQADAVTLARPLALLK
jgi:DNA-binding protein HU-beta